MDRNPFEPLPGKTTKHPAELPRTAYRMNPAYRRTGEGLEQSPPAGADGEAPLPQVRLELTDHALGQSPSRPLQIEYELGLRSRCREQLVQAEPAAPRCSNLPAIPENRDRPGRLQVPDFESAPIEADVSFYKGRFEALGVSKIGELVPSAVRDEERARPTVVELRQEWPAHRGRV